MPGAGSTPNKHFIITFFYYQHHSLPLIHSMLGRRTKQTLDKIAPHPFHARITPPHLFHARSTTWAGTTPNRNLIITFYSMPVIRSMSFITFIFCYQHSMPVIHSISWNHTKHETLNTHLIITLFIILQTFYACHTFQTDNYNLHFIIYISNKRALAVNAQHLSGHEALPTVELVSCPLVLLYTSGVAMLRGLERWD